MSYVEIINLSCYKFAPMVDLVSIQSNLRQIAHQQGLKGTILLAPEGINFFVSGTRPRLDILVDYLKKIQGLENITPKASRSSDQPFKRMLVKIKKEIISFGIEGIDPYRCPSAKISAIKLKQWLDEGRPITLLDTRNEYEVRMGTFKGAIATKIWNFRDFPNAVESLPPELKQQKIVMFCTGGIRCEKAAPFMEMKGYTDIFQLDGGILKYFEEVGGSHYSGECFVFDERVGVGPDLRQTCSVLCFNCQMPLSIEDQQRDDYIYEKSCRHCLDGKPKGRGNTAQTGT